MALRTVLFSQTKFKMWKTPQFLWTSGLESFYPLMGVNSSSLSLFLNAPPWCQAAALSEISRFLITRYVVNWKRLAAPYCIPLHVWARGEQWPSVQRPWGGLSFHSYLPTPTCTWAAEQAPLCVFFCGRLPNVCLTRQRVCDAAARLTPVISPLMPTHTGIWPLSSRRKLLYMWVVGH